MLFGGFTRCLYPLQKFDSDTERRFAIILERDATKWLKPAKGQFQIYYKLGAEQPEYIPDFVAETDTAILMVETKARTDINTQEVQAKAAAASALVRSFRLCRRSRQQAVAVLASHDDGSRCTSSDFCASNRNQIEGNPTRKKKQARCSPRPSMCRLMMSFMEQMMSKL